MHGGRAVLASVLDAIADQVLEQLPHVYAVRPQRGR
jgi:hypothetical protein